MPVSKTSPRVDAIAALEDVLAQMAAPLTAYQQGLVVAKLRDCLRNVRAIRVSRPKARPRS